MVRWPRIGTAALALLSGMTAGCEGLADRTTVGPPLVTVHGTIGLAPGTTVEGELRLALAWYPGLLTFAGGADINSPDPMPACDFSIALQTEAQGVSYRPNFPINYTFDITAPPPKSVQTNPDPSFSPINTAIGAVVAYEDRNRNGILDRCKGATCPDRILGASSAYLPGFLPAGQMETLIAYQDNVSTPSNPVINSGFYLEAIGVEPDASGFNPSTLFPLPQTPIDLTLSDAPILEIAA